MEIFRSFTKTIFFKILVTLIIASFVLWGVGDIFRSNLSSYIAKIGGLKITEQHIEYEVQNLKNRYNITDDKNDSVLKSIALQNIVKDELTKLEKEDLGFTLSNKAAFSVLQTLPEFQNKKKEFAIDKFKTFLKLRNLSEKALFNSIKTNVTSELFNNSFSANTIEFEKLQSLQSKYINESRLVTVIQVTTPTTVSYNQLPSDAELVDFYNLNKESFLIPATSVVDIIYFNCTKFKNKASVSYNEIQKAYKKNSNYIVAEKRELQQIFAKEKDQIDVIYNDLISSDISFVKKATEVGMSKADVNIGLQSKDSILESFLPVFSLKVGEISEPIAGPNGYHIFKITKVIAKKTTPLSAVKGKITKEIALKKSCNLSNESFQKAQNLLLKNKEITEIANELSLKLENYDINSSTKKIGDIPENELEKTIFSILKDNDLKKEKSLNLGSDSNLIYKITEKNEARYYAIDEIKGKLVSLWKKGKYKEKYKDKINHIKEKAEILLKEGVKKENLVEKLRERFRFRAYQKTLTRFDKKIKLPNALQDIIFSLKAESEVTNMVEDNNIFYLAILNKISTKKLTKGEKFFEQEKLKSSYIEHFNNSIDSLYLGYLAKKHKVTFSKNK